MPNIDRSLSRRRTRSLVRFPKCNSSPSAKRGQRQVHGRTLRLTSASSCGSKTRRRWIVTRRIRFTRRQRRRFFFPFRRKSCSTIAGRNDPGVHTMTTSNILSGANEFAGKRVLVTGGTKGAGKAIADRFQHGGAIVIITARSAPTEKTDNHFIQADVSTAEGTTKVINEILNRFQGIDTIIHNVGGTSAPSGGFITVTDEIWQENINENLFPSVPLDRGLLPSMIQRGSGVIIHISSIQRTLPLYDSTLAYAAAKA